MTDAPVAEAAAAPQEAVGGWHFGEWAAELIGTALLVFVAMSCFVLVFNADSPFKDQSTSMRLLILGLMFTVIIVSIAVSPLGRLSGAHINPAVTLAFWITGHVHPHDLAGYWAAQFTGGVIGAFGVKVWGEAATKLEYGAIHPAVSTPKAIAIEAGMVGAIILAMFVCLSSTKTARWTPLAAGLVVALNTWKGAEYTSTGLNPARILGPDVVAGDYRSWWVYFVATALGAAVVAGLWRLGPRVVLTAKLYHDPAYRSVLKTHLPARPASSDPAPREVG